MKYKLKDFTKEEIKDIEERYAEWLKPENIVWIEREFKSTFEDLKVEFGKSGSRNIKKK